MRNNEQATQTGSAAAQPSAPETEGSASQPVETPEPNEFAAVKARLEEIAREVDDESISLDDALDLYEEAVKLGLKASDLLEVDIVVEEESAADLSADPAGAVPSPSSSSQANDGDAPNNADPIQS